MNSFILFSFFYLVNIGFKIKADDYNKNIKIDCDSNQYFYSINYTCLPCESGNLFNNICYSATKKKSIYGLNISNPEKNCNKDEILTELDEEGKHLGDFMCAKTIQEYSGGNSSPIETDYSFPPYIDIKRPERGVSQPLTFRLRNSDIPNINYTNDSCEKGLYEKSCQYLANLCALSMYFKERDTYFCQTIFNFEKKNNM